MSDICRICLGSESVNHSIFDSQSELLFKITSHLPIKVSPVDGLPKKICDKCSLKITDIHEFCRKAVDAEKKLLLSLLHFPDADPFIQKEEDGPSLIGEVTTENDEELSNKYTLIEVPISLKDIKKEVGVFQPSRVDYTFPDIKIKEEFKSEYITVENEDQNSHINFDSDDNWNADEIVEVSSYLNLNNNVPKIKKLYIIEKDKNATVKTRKKKRTKAEKKVQEDDDEAYDNIPLAQRADVIKTSKCKPREKNKKKSWQCLTCFDIMSSRFLLVQHYKDHALTDVKKEEPQLDAEFEVLKPPDVETKCFKCLYCSKVVESRRKILLHIKMHVTNRAFICNICSPPRAYKRMDQLIFHERVHSGDMPMLQCQFEGCPFTSHYSSTVTQHHKAVHTKIFKHTCEICHKGFHARSTFEDHMNKHNGLNPYECDVCFKKFFSRANKQLHRNTMHPETSARPNRPCSKCKEVFSTAKKLRKHMEKEHGTFCTRRMCDLCGKELSSWDHLRLHLRIHSGEKPFNCTYCKKSFSRNCYLVQHTRIHTGERPYKCSFCEKGFSQRSSMVIHERGHTGDRPFICKNCDKSFTSQGLLTVHLKTCPPYSLELPDSLSIASFEAGKAPVGELDSIKRDPTKGAYGETDSEGEYDENSTE